MLFRDATPDDAVGIAAVVIAASRHAFEDLVGGQALELLDLEDEAGEWRTRLAEPSSNVVSVVEHDARVLGVAAWSSSRDSNADNASPARHGRLTHLYVAPAAQRAGLGSRLLEHAEDRFRGLGGETAQLWLHEGNVWAAALFARHGWGTDEDRPADGGPERRWTRTL